MVAALRHPLVVERPVEVQRLTGPDRNSFLHGLLTADVKALPADGVVDAAMCDGKGNALEVLTVVSRSDALLALGAGGRGATLGALLDKYLFPADRVELSDESAEWRCYEVLGPHADAVVSEALEAEAVPGVGRCVELSSSAVLLGQSSLGGSDGRGYAVLCRGGDDLTGALRAALTAAAEARSGGMGAYEPLRIRRGAPRHGYEFGDGAPNALASPLSLGLWGSVHLDKGCYLGNERIVRLARAKWQRKELFGIAFAPQEAPGGAAVVGETLSSGAEVVMVAAAPASEEEEEEDDDDDEAAEEVAAARAKAAAEGATVGQVTSVLPADEAGGPFALALLQRAAQRVGTVVSVGGARGEVVQLPAATRFGAQAGGGIAPAEDEAEADAAAAAAAAEAERKRLKLEAMAAKMRALGLTP